MKKTTARTAQMLMLLTVLAALLAGTASSASDVPAAVVTALNTVAAPGLPSSEAYIALDACGDIYTIKNYDGTVSEIPAGGGTPITVLGYSGINYDPDSLWIDSAKANLYVTYSPYNVYRIPITNCVPQVGSKTSFSIGNLGAVSYYWSASSVAADGAGNVFIGTDVACCASPNELLEENSSDSTGSTLLTGLSSPITAITVDSSDNIYYVAGGALYELAYNSTGKSYAASPTSFGSGYNTVVGVSLDAAGNLYVADSGNSAIFEIPYELSGTTGALNPSDQFVVATGLSINTSPAIDSAGNLYYTNNSATVYELTRDNVNFGSSPVSTAASATLNVVFNQSVTPATISYVTASGVFASASSAGTCVAGTSYTAGSSCTIDVSFTPTVPGVGTGALVLTSSSGAAISTTSLYGTGVGAGFTADPGTAASVGSGFKTPSAAALDVAGDLFIADPGSSTVWEVPSGASTPVSIGTSLSAPAGVAVDAAGNLFVADTGNGRVVEIPVVAGSLSASAQFDVIPNGTSIAGAALSSPAGVSIDSEGALYVSDTGNDRIVYLPRSDNWNLGAATTVGSSLSGPLATTITPAGLIYIADSGNGRVVSVPYPNPAAPQTLVVSGYKEPSALATDAAGDLFVVDQGHFAVLRIPNIGGTLTPSSAFNLTDGIVNPYGLAMNAAGNAYVTDNVNAAAYFISRTGATQSFGQWNPGSTSNPQNFLIENSGNAALTLGSPAYTASGDTSAFTEIASESGACANGESLALGADCRLEATFTPAALGTYTETLTFSSNAKNTSSSQVAFTGSGAITVPTTTSLTITSPSGNPYYGKAITVSTTVTASSGTASGTVELLVDGLSATRTTLNASGSATLSLPNGLTAGSHTLQTSYEGATVNFTSYSASQSAAQTISVTRVPTATALTLSTLYTQPLSQPAGAAFTITAAVSSTYLGTPTGSVVFVIHGATGGTVQQTVPLTASSTGYQAAYTYTPPAPASGTPYDVLTVVAAYSGDTNFQGSGASASLDVTVTSGVVLSTVNGTTLSTNSTSGSSINSSSITFTSTSYGGWQGVVGYQCVASTLPANAICVFSPGQVSVLAGTPVSPYPPATTSLKVVVNNPPNSPAQSSSFWWLAALFTASLFQQRKRLARHGLARSLILLFAALGAMTSIGAISACSSSPSFTTPAGSSTVTVVADADPYTASGVGNTTQTCGNNSSGTTDPTVAPCSQTTFQVTLNVK